MSLQDIYKKAGVVMKPAAMKDGKLYSQQPHSGAGDFNFSRADGVQTRINKHGLIEDVANNVPRLSYDIVDGKVSDCPHLLLEPQRENVVPFSEDFSSGWVNSNTSANNNDIVSPDGYKNAAKVSESASTSTHILYRNLSASVTAGADCYMSCFVKKGTKRYFQLREGYSGARINIDTNTFTMSDSSGLTDYSIQNYGGGWYRISFKFTAHSSGNCQFAIYMLSDSQSTSFSGDADSNVYVWGAQIEQGSYATSYIPTSGSSETRQADICNGSGNSETFNGSEGVLFLELAALNNDLSERRISVSNSTTGNVVRVGFTSVSNRILGVVYNGGNQATLTSSSYTIVDYHKVALKYKENDFALWVDGTEVSTDSLGTTFASGLLGELAFDDGNGGSDFYGKVKQLAVINEALTDEQLQLLTTP